MITWIQRFFLKHNKWLFGSLLVVIVVTFVLTIGPQSFFDGSSNANQEEIMYYGYDLSSPVDQQAMINSAQISAILNPQLRIGQNNLSNYGYLRVAGLGIAEQMRIPQPNEEKLTEYIKTKAAFQNQEGEFDPESYAQIKDLVNNSARFDSKSMARVLKEDYQIEAVIESLAGPLYVLPKEVKENFIQINSTYDFLIASRNFASFDPATSLEENDIKAYFNENPLRYEIPEQIKVTAVLFKGENFLDEVKKPEQAVLEVYFDRNKSKYHPKASEEEEVEEVSLNEVINEVTSDWLLDQAKLIAEEKSELFSVELWERGIKHSDPSFSLLAEKFQAQLIEVPAYSESSPPNMPNIPRSLLTSIWTYREGSRSFSEIGKNKDGAVLLVIDSILAPRLPAFEEIQAQVEADYLRDEKVRIFTAEGPAIKEKLTTALNEGVSPSDAAEELGLEINDLDPFLGREVPAELQVNDLWQQSRYLDSNEVSDMIFTGNEGIFVFAQNIEKVDIDQSSPEFQAFVEEQTSNSNEFLGWTRLQEISDKALKALGLAD